MSVNESISGYDHTFHDVRLSGKLQIDTAREILASQNSHPEVEAFLAQLSGSELPSHILISLPDRNGLEASLIEGSLGVHKDETADPHQRVRASGLLAVLLKED